MLINLKLGSGRHFARNYNDQIQLVHICLTELHNIYYYMLATL